VDASIVNLVTLGASSAATFDRSLLVLGGLLVAGALVSGLVRRSFLSLAAIYVVVGFLCGDGALGVLSFDPRSAFVEELAVLALILILFRDGLEVEGEMLQRAWHLPLRKLVLAMPLTAASIACAAKLLTDLSWTQAFLLGALLAPTDPVLSSSVVTNSRVPRLVRHSLNLESGLNDGLALPAVLALIAALDPARHDFVWWRFVIQDVGLGFAFGIGIGLLAAAVLPRGDGVERGIPAHQGALLMLGIAFATYGVTVLEPKGNGLIAVFVCAITLGVRRPEVRRYFQHGADDVIEIAKLAIFVVFGALLTVHGLFSEGWAAVAIVLFTLLIARSLAVFAALAGTGVDTATKAFMAWFGPKGVATMTFSLLVLSRSVPAGERIFNLAALVVFASILAHGLSDSAGVEWIARRAQRGAGRSPAADGAG